MALTFYLDNNGPLSRTYWLLRPQSVAQRAARLEQSLRNTHLN